MSEIKIIILSSITTLIVNNIFKIIKGIVKFIKYLILKDYEIVEIMEELIIKINSLNCCNIREITNEIYDKKIEIEKTLNLLKYVRKFPFIKSFFNNRKRMLDFYIRAFIQVGALNAELQDLDEYISSLDKIVDEINSWLKELREKNEILQFKSYTSDKDE